MAMASRVWLSLFLVVFCILSSALTGIYAEESESKEFVLTLDHSNFSDTVSKHDLIVVEFYAPWCGHCKKLAPEYEKAASILSSNDPPLLLAKVDASEEVNRGLASEYGVQGFPTIKILRNGGKTVQEYKGPREADGIVAYVKKQSGPASVEVKTVEDASSFTFDKKIVIVGVFPKFSGEEFENFTAVADKLRSDYEFGHTTDAKLLPRGESSVTGPVIRLLKPFDERFVDFKDFHTDAVEKFIEESSLPIVTEYNNDPNNHPFIVKFFNNPNAKAMLFLNFSEVADAFRPKYHEVAEKYRAEGISFLLGDLESSKGAFQYFGLIEDQVPVIVIQTNDGKKYVKPYLKPEHIEDWVKEFKLEKLFSRVPVIADLEGKIIYTDTDKILLVGNGGISGIYYEAGYYDDGKLLPFVKSEPIPEQNNEPVKVVVADSLRDVFFNSGKNVLLEFYAPWCGHCKQLAPILDEVAVSYESDPDVVIAKFDATANDVPSDFDVQGFPTIYFKSKSGSLLTYDEDRTKESFVAFIEKNRDKTDKQADEQTDKEAEKPSDKQDSAKDEL